MLVNEGTSWVTFVFSPATMAVPAERGTEAAESKDIMERAFKLGCRVIFFDSHRQPHEAIVTNWFHGGPDGQTLEEYLQKPGANPAWLPCCNLVWVSADANKLDPYGRQLERSTSTTYGRSQSTPFLGMCWCWPDEFEEAKALSAEAYAKAVVK